MRARIAAALGALLVTTTFPVFSQSDLDLYIQHIRARGMTDSAEGDLTMVAMILIGSTNVTFNREPDGGYSESFRSWCPRPGAAPGEVNAARAKLAAEAEVWIGKLKKLADTDHSGFVSSEEARRLREVVLLGLEVSQMDQSDTKTPAAVARAIFRSEDEVRTLLGRYKEVALAIGTTDGVSLPALPNPIAGAV